MSILRSRKASEGDVKRAYSQFKKDRTKAHEDYQDALQAVTVLGLTQDQILLETHDGRYDTKSAKRTLALLNADGGETPIEPYILSDSQIEEIEKIKGRMDLLEEVAPEILKKKRRR